MLIMTGNSTKHFGIMKVLQGVPMGFTQNDIFCYDKNLTYSLKKLFYINSVHIIILLKN